MNEKNGPVQAGEHNIVLKFSQTEGHVTRSNLSLQLAMQFFAEKNIAGSSQDVRRTQLVLRPAMRLYFTPAEYLKMSAAF